MLRKSILQKILAFFARAAIRKYKPMVIGIAGSVGKTSTRSAIYAALKQKYRVRTAEKNYNNEIGLPLAILGIPHYGRNIFMWLCAFVRIAARLTIHRSLYPEILILEYAVDRPGDMDYLLSIAKPNIAVATAIGDVPVHVEFFKNPEELIAEKAKLVSALPLDGWAVLNHDDYAVYDMKGKTKAHVMTYGFEEHASLQIINYQLSIIKNEQGEDVPDGVSYKLEEDGHVVPIRLRKIFGIPQAYSTAAAAAVGRIFKINLVEISEALFREYEPPPGRMRLIEGIRGSRILDDTYNAAPDAMRAALETLKELPGHRKIAVLGDMLEIGIYTEEVHRAIGDQAAEFVDFLFTAGSRAKFIADEALNRGIEKNARMLTRDQVFSFDDAVSLGKALDAMIEEGDLILIKGSQSMRMEKAVEEIMAHPEQATELLVRQEDEWKKL